jgi:hypothetical protein
VIGNAPVHQWQALKWSDEYLKAVHLSDGNKATVQCSSSTGEAFMHFDIDNDALLRDMSGFGREVRVYEMNMSTFMGLIFNSTTRHPSAQHCYLSMALATFPAVLQNDIDVQSLGLPAGVSPSLWISTGGSATQAHFDESPNVFVQLHGKKRIFLWPPSSAPALYLFPELHPRSRKSQLQFYTSNRVGESLNTSADFRRERALGPPTEVELEPGDMLIIPPYWIHHVVADSAVTISANAFLHGSSAAEEFAAALQSLPLPVHDENGRVELSAIRLFLAALLSEVNIDPFSFAQELLRTRYPMAFERQRESASSPRARARCYTAGDTDPSTADAHGAAGVDNDRTPLDQAKLGDMIRVTKAYFDSTTIARDQNDAGARQQSQYRASVQQLVLQQYMELVIGSFVHQPEEVPVFLGACWPGLAPD